APAAQVPVRVGGPLERIGAAKDRLYLARRRAREEVRERLAHHPLALEAVEEVEADDRPRVTQQRAGRDLVRPLGGDAADDDPAKRRKRPAGGLEDLSPRHVEDDVELAAEVGLLQA